MRLLTKKKQKEALKRLLANSIIAWDAAMKFEDKDKMMDACNHIQDNLADAAYIIGGNDAMIEVGEAFINFISKEDKH